MGTGGTLTGVGQVLKPRLPGLKIIGWSQPVRPCYRAGRPAHTRFRASAQASCPACWTPSLIDEIVQVSNDEAFDMARRLPREEGLLVGISSGAASMPRCNSRCDPKTQASVLWSIVPSNGERYLSTALFAHLAD